MKKGMLIFISIMFAFYWSPASQPLPTDTITLENSDFRIVLSRERPAILEYQVKAKEWIILENPGSSGPGISFLQGALPVMRNRTVTTFEASLANNQVVYHTKITYENKPAVEFDLVYRLNGKSVTITMRNVVEFKNFYLLNVQLPELLTIRSAGSHGKLIIPSDAGRMIDIEKASLKSYEYDIDWLNPILTGFAYNSEVLGMIDTKSIENHTIVSVSEGRDKRYGSYPKNPGWDPDVICIDPNGNIMRGGAWDGEQSYLISSYKYAVKSGLERVRFTLDRYPVKEAYFIDVLAGGYKGGRKYDFNPKSPAGAIKNLEGKLMLVKEFNKRGIDVATEDFTGFFVGHVGTFGDICAFDNIYFYGEEQIPLIPFIYHGKTSFGLKTTSQSFYPRTFLYGQRAQKLANRRSPFRVSEYILDALPKQKLYGKTMDSYERYGDLERVTYEDGIVVEANIATGKYSVKMADGLVIAKDNTAFAPIEENVFLACSRDGGTLSYRIPDTWKNTEKIRVYSVNNDGSLKNIQYNLDDRLLKFITEPGAPYRVVFEY